MPKGEYKDTPQQRLWGIENLIKKVVSIPVIAVGKINTPHLAEKIIEEGMADFIAMTRSLIADPYLPAKAMAGETEDIRGCIYCLEDCAEKGVPGIGRACSVNPFAGQEYLLKMTPALKKKNIVIAGGGPAGIQTAILASQRGHNVTLYEKDGRGGQLRLASMAPFKGEMSEALRFLIHSLGQTHVKLIIGIEITGKEILSVKPDAVVIATGSRPIFPDIHGINEQPVFDARTIYEENPELRGHIIIIGGGEIGCETADYLSSGSRKITVIESLDRVLRNMKDIPREDLLKRLEQKGVAILTECKVISITKENVIAEDKEGNRKEIKADSIIISVGSISENSLYNSLKENVVEIYMAGDASRPCNLGAAIRSGCELGLKI
ncbi:MAG: FAD-dependent oxidoreductase [Nitrospirae bacterium]|nr:FAD-dependent oxidoreductase [Nitrospirota bacterium]